MYKFNATVWYCQLFLKNYYINFVPPISRSDLIGSLRKDVPIDQPLAFQNKNDLKQFISIFASNWISGKMRVLNISCYFRSRFIMGSIIKSRC